MKRLVKRCVWMATIGAVPLLFLFLYPRPASAQLDLGATIAYLVQIISTVTQQTKVILSTEQAANSQLTFFQQTMYPANQISRILQLSSQYLSVMTSGQTMFNSPVNSATLPQTTAYESTILGGNPNNIASIASNYHAVYGSLPTQSSVSSSVYTVLDANDAQAQAALKKSVQLDAIAQKEEQLSIQYMQQLNSAAPGTASLISAQAAAWNLQASAYSQEGMAQLLRAESAETSFQNFEVKNAVNAHNSAVQSFGIPTN